MFTCIHNVLKFESNHTFLAHWFVQFCGAQKNHDKNNNYLNKCTTISFICGIYWGENHKKCIIGRTQENCTVSFHWFRILVHNVHLQSDCASFSHMYRSVSVTLFTTNFPVVCPHFDRMRMKIHRRLSILYLTHTNQKLIRQIHSAQTTGQDQDEQWTHTTTFKITFFVSHRYRRSPQGPSSLPFLNQNDTVFMRGAHW